MSFCDALVFSFVEDLQQAKLERTYQKYLRKPKLAACTILDWEDAIQTAALELLERPPRELTLSFFQLRVISRLHDQWRRPKLKTLDVELLAQGEVRHNEHSDLFESLSSNVFLTDKQSSTLLSLIEHAGNTSRTATALSITPSTLRKRMQRIRNSLTNAPGQELAIE